MGNLFFDEPRKTITPHDPLAPITWNDRVWNVGDWIVRTRNSAFVRCGEVYRIAGFPWDGDDADPRVTLVGHEHRKPGTFCLNYFRPATAAEISDHG